MSGGIATAGDGPPEKRKYLTDCFVVLKNAQLDDAAKRSELRKIKRAMEAARRPREKGL